MPLKPAIVYSCIFSCKTFISSCSTLYYFQLNTLVSRCDLIQSVPLKPATTFKFCNAAQASRCFSLFKFCNAAQASHYSRILQCCSSQTLLFYFKFCNAAQDSHYSRILQCRSSQPLLLVQYLAAHTYS